jgi:hypothetical protein
MTDIQPNDDRRWAIVRDGTEYGEDVKFLTESQEWGSLESAMLFSSENEAVNGAETLCPPFMPGHAEPVGAAR